MHGFGQLVIAKNNTHYEGEFFRGGKQGWGRFVWRDGQVYEGEWLRGRINGVGRYVWEDGREFTGEWFR